MIRNIFLRDFMLRIKNVYAYTDCSIATFRAYEVCFIFFLLWITKFFDRRVIDILTSIFTKKISSIQKKYKVLYIYSKSIVFESIKHHPVSTKFSTSLKLSVYRSNRHDHSKRYTRRSLSTNDCFSFPFFDFLSIVRYEEQLWISFSCFLRV